MARSGDLIRRSKPVGGAQLREYMPKKVVHVGHSYGSIGTSGFLSRHGTLSDGAILTGFVVSPQTGKVTPATFGLEYAPAHNPALFGDRGSGYLVQATRSNVQQIFLKKGSFEDAALAYAEAIKQTSTVGEMVSVGPVLASPVVGFKGPLQFFLAEHDYAICAGDCKNVTTPEALRQLYPGPSSIDIYVQPNTGHGLTLSQNATAGYQVMFNWLAAKGL
jgi:pimeloyl-ACP methyl ester carboxylesterase